MTSVRKPGPVPDATPWPYKPSDAHGWPAAADCPEPASELCKAKLEVRVKRTEEEIARKKALTDADLALQQEYYKAVLEVGKGSIERARSSAEIVQKSSAAIVTLYTGVLALAFSVTDNPLSEKALFSTVLLGLAIVLSTAFLAYVPSPGDSDTPDSAGDEQQLGERLTNMFVRWNRDVALNRGHLLRASVIALAGAVLLLPAPFIAIGAKEGPRTEVKWPTPPAEGDDVRLTSILYKAQVAEAAERRKAPVGKEEDPALWWALFGLCCGVVAVVLLAGVSSRMERTLALKGDGLDT